MENILLILLLAFAFFVVFYAYTPISQQNKQLTVIIDSPEEKADSCSTANDEEKETIAKSDYFASIQ